MSWGDLLHVQPNPRNKERSMGDRAIVIFTSRDGVRCSPAIYLHWSGDKVPGLINNTKDFMGDRLDDVEYAAARFTGIAHESLKETNLSLGISNVPLTVETAILGAQVTGGASAAAREVLEEYSPGDAGVVIVDASDFSWQAFGGYLADKKTA